MQEHSGQNQKANLVKWNGWKVQFRCLRKSWWNKFYKKPLWKKAKTTKNTKDKYFMDQAANFFQGRQNRKDNSDEISKKTSNNWLDPNKISECSASQQNAKVVATFLP